MIVMEKPVLKKQKAIKIVFKKDIPRFKIQIEKEEQEKKEKEQRNPLEK